MSRYGQGRGGRPWRRLRDSVAKRDGYLCQPCLGSGRLTTYAEVDHIIPLSQGGTDAETNLQAICHACHEIKNIREAGGKPVVGCDADGWPS